MPYVDAIGDIARVTIAAIYPDNQVQEVNHNFLCTTPSGADSRPGLGAAVLSIWSAYAAFLPSNVSLYGYKVSIVNRKPPPMPRALVSSTTGTASGLLMPTQTRPVIGWQTINAGRSQRGRTFAFTPAASLMGSTGFPSATLTTGLNTIASALLAGMTPSGSLWLLTLAHRIKGPPVTWSSTVLNTGTGTGKFGTQRKSGNYGRVNASPW